MSEEREVYQHGDKFKIVNSVTGERLNGKTGQLRAVSFDHGCAKVLLRIDGSTELYEFDRHRLERVE